MKRIYLLRHAKTEPIGLLNSDFSRNLIEKGWEDIEKVSQYFQNKYQNPDLIIHSNANRTTQTATQFSKNIGFKGPLKSNEDLFHATSSEILDIIQSEINHFNNIMIVGHNFGISHLALSLSSSGCEELSTCGMAIIDFNNNIELYQGVLVEYIKPKLI